MFHWNMSVNGLNHLVIWIPCCATSAKYLAVLMSKYVYMKMYITVASERVVRLPKYLTKSWTGVDQIISKSVVCSLPKVLVCCHINLLILIYWCSSVRIVTRKGNTFLFPTGSQISCKAQIFIHSIGHRGDFHESTSAKCDADCCSAHPASILRLCESMLIFWPTFHHVALRHLKPSA